MSPGKKRSSVANRYLAAIHCPAEPMVPVQSPTERPQSPQTAPWNSEMDSFGSSKQASIIQTRSTGNSPSSSRKSRASRTPPRDSVSSSAVETLGCTSIPQLRPTGFFPATSSGLVDTDGSSSLTNSRSSTPPLYDEDDPAALLRKAQQNMLKTPYQLQKATQLDSGWRDRMDGTANYKSGKWSKKKATSRNFSSSQRDSPTRQRASPSLLDISDEAPTEVMMNLSSVRQQQPRRSPDIMSNVTGTSTEIITNRTTDLHRKILHNVDERDSSEPKRRPQHESIGAGQRGGARSSSGRRRWPPATSGMGRKRIPHQPRPSQPPPQKPIEIQSLLSDTSITEETEESSGWMNAPLYPGSMPMGRLGQHVGQEKLSANVIHQKQQVQRQNSKGSMQDRSLTSSVGVETGVHVVSKSEPALKRVFKETQPDAGIAVSMNQRMNPQSSASNIALTRPLSPQHEEETSSAEGANYRPPRLGEFPPRAPQSDEKQPSIASNPFMVKYSARGTSPTERRGLLDTTVGSPQSTASSGGWTPVPLSSSGMISEDFILDLDHTPLGKDEEPITALFSSDRIPSTSKSTLENFYRNDPTNEESLDGVGPPNIHRVTAQHPAESVRLSGAAPRDAPGAVAGDEQDEEDAENDLLLRLASDVRPIVDSPQAVSAPAATFSAGNAVNDDNEAQAKSASPSHSHRRALMLRRRRLSPGKANRNDVEERDAVPLNGDVASDYTENRESGVPSAIEPPVSRNLFPAEEDHDSNDQDWHQDDSALREQPVGVDTVGDHVPAHVDQINGGNASGFGDFNSRQQQSRSGPDDRPISPPKEMPREYVPPWKAKIKEKRSVGKEELVQDDGNAVTDDQQRQKYIPPWKQKLLKQRSATKLVPANANANEEGAASNKPKQEYVPPWKLKAWAKESAMKDKVPDEDVVSQRTAHKHIPSWKLKMMTKETSVKDTSSRNVSAASNKPSKENIPQWKRKAMARESETNSSPVENDSLQNIPKWKLELMKKKGIATEDKREEVASDKKVIRKEAGSDALAVRTWPTKSLSVRERAKAFSESKNTDGQYVSPWVAKASRRSSTRQHESYLVQSFGQTRTNETPAQHEIARNTSAMQSAPARLSRRDRAIAMSRESNESSFFTTGSARSKRSHSETLDESSQDGESPSKAMKTSRHPHSTRVTAKLLGAVSAHVDPSVTSGPSTGESKTNGTNSPRKSMVLAAHLAATVDDVSPQDRYRRRFRNTDETTATGDSRERSDVRSLKSFFEASHATLPSDEESDDRTVESLRSKFEPSPEKEEEVGEVSKMRSMFEKTTTSNGGRKNESGGSRAVSDAMTKFKPATPRWTPSTKESTRRRKKPLKGPSFVSPGDSQAARSSSPKEGAVVSAPSKLESRPRPSRSPPPKPEDGDHRRWSHNEGRDTQAPKGLSVAERIRALKLKQSPQVTAENDEELLSTAARNTKEESTGTKRISPTADLTPQWKKHMKTVQSMASKRQAASRDPPEGDLDERIRTAYDSPPKARSTIGAFPSVKDRVNAFSHGKSEPMKADEHVSSQPTAKGRKSWPPENDHILSYSDRHLQSQQVTSTPSDERTGSGMVSSDPPASREQHDASSVATSGADSDYDDGVTLDLSIAEISQLTNPTCIQSKEGGPGSSSDGDDSSEHTSDVNRGSNVEGKHPSEASSSQTSEAAAPLIARMKFSDDASNSVGSAKGAFPGRSRPVQSRWEPLTPVVDETEPARHSPDGTHESAWSPDEIASTFPVESSFDSAAEKGNKTSWQPFQVENWDSSPSFGTNWTPPSNSGPVETAVSEATSLGRVSENTPVRRNTTARRASPPPQRPPLDQDTKRLPAQSSLFSRTHPTRPVESSPRIPVTPRSSPVKVESAPTSGGLSSPTTGISKHALLMSKLRSLKEARMRRNAVAGFHRTSVYSSERSTGERPPTGSSRSSPTASRSSPPASRSSPTASALAPFLRPGFENSPSRPSNANRYPDRLPASSPRTVDDEQSLSTKSSTQFGGYKFVESLELD